MREAQFNRSMTIAFKQVTVDDVMQVTDEQKISFAQYVREAVEEKLERERS